MAKEDLFEKGDRVKFSQEAIDKGIAGIYDSKKRKTPKDPTKWRGTVTTSMRRKASDFPTVAVKWDHTEAKKGHRYSTTFIDFSYDEEDGDKCLTLSMPL